MAKKPQSKKFIQDIILDTCIIQYLGNENIAPRLKNYLVDLAGRGFNFAISEVTFAELLSNISLGKEIIGRKTLALFKRYFVGDRVLISSAQLSSLFKQVQIDNFEKIKIQSDHISLADKIIGATAILSGSLILTANIQDFPNPYFFPVEEKQVIYKRKNKSNMLYLQILSPNTQLILKLFKRRK
jgi:predicted nucleic acid-binding protein